MKPDSLPPEIELDHHYSPYENGSTSDGLSLAVSLVAPWAFQSTVCFVQVHASSMACMLVNHRHDSTVQETVQQTRPTTSITSPIIKYPFEMNNFTPNVAFHFSGYTRSSASRYFVVFIEQKLITTPNNGTPTSIEMMKKQIKYLRRYQIYSFARFDLILNLTESGILPDFVYRIPATLEITGVFSWTSKLIE